MNFPFFKKIGFWGILCPTKHGGNHASRWIRDLWSKGVSLILSYFCVFGDFFPFSKKFGLMGILGPPSYGIGATIRIGREILCLPYAGFLLVFLYISEIISLYNISGAKVGAEQFIYCVVNRRICVIRF